MSNGDAVSIVFEALNWLGFNRESTIPLLVIALVAYFLFSQKLNSLEQKFSAALTPIKHAIVEIQTLLQNAGYSIKYLLTETRASPIKPTEFGWKLIKESGLAKILAENKKKFLSELDKELKTNKSVTAYDVQEKAREVLVGHKDAELMNPVKSYAFAKGADIETILRTGGLPLRDEYLKEHPEIK